jgi:PKD repeat protein
MKKLVAVGAFLLPLWASAAVIINEVAWMGSVVSSADEWIELRNTDAVPVDLSGWTITADDGSPSIPLSGVIAANGYFLIERTDDESVPGVAADLIVPFGNGLSNSGEILRLRDASGAVLDTVDGSGGWVGIGGDNATKDTAQRTEQGWITAPATPRAENASAPAVSATPATETGSTSTSATTLPSAETAVSKPKPGAYPKPNITVSAGEDARGFTKMEIAFSGDALGLYDEQLSYATYRWNFGDGTTAIGKDVTHAYRFPGEYVVTLEVRHGDRVAVDRLTAIIVDPQVSVAEVIPGAEGYIALRNFSGREINLSGWAIESQGKTFIFSPNTFILPGRTIRVANALSGLEPLPENVLIRLPGGATIREEKAVAASPTARSDAPASLGIVVRPKAAPAKEPSAETSSERIAPARITEAPPKEAEQAATVLWSREEPMSFERTLRNEWILIGVGIALVAGAGVLLFRSHTPEPTEAEEYAIIEEIIESADDGEKARH